MKVLLVFCVLLLASLAGAQTNGARAGFCQTKENCGDCISASPDCAWCSHAEYDKEKKPRCDFHEHLISNKCPEDSIADPGDKVALPEDKPLSDSDTLAGAIQIKPQKVRITTRPNKPVKLKVTFRQAKNYPVDLYYLMDLSNSMGDDKANLATLGGRIAKNMSAITQDFRLGFGSFVDKVAMPYVSTIESKLREPCDGCASPYGFKHQLDFTNSADEFKDHVLAADISGNLDEPEGGFDAIMQAIVCNRVGWRRHSRKMMLFSTDAGFHYAGDGKLAGIVEPNDGECHLDANGVYTESTTQDYPSVSQIAAKIVEKKVNVIFAVTAEQINTYERLRHYIEGSVAGVLANDSSNIVQLVQSNYNKITSKVELNMERAENITVIMHSKCLDINGELKETNTCEGLKIGDNVEFEISIEVKECGDRSKWKRKFYIYPVGLEERLEININLLCECDCEKPANKEFNSPKCTNGNGTFACGVCLCNPKRFGEFCECGGAEATSSAASDEKCIKKGSSQICSGRGKCVCGQCKCYARSKNADHLFSGNYCECDDYSCNYHNGQLCGGKERGKCSCGKCLCESGFEGEACDCPTSNATCIAKNGKLCNGVGECSCGTCRCDEETTFRGPTCEDCPTCDGAQCSTNKACVQCSAKFGTGPYKTEQECMANCHTPKIYLVDKAQVENENTTMCQYKDEDDCTLFFTYENVADNKLLIKAQRTKVCPEPVNVLAIVLGVIGGIVAVGVALLLIWKLLTVIHDRRELAKFEKERKNAKWDTGENPIYIQATSTYNNPTYKGGNN